MINLLPLENKKNVWREYRGRRAIVIGLVMMFLLLTGIILLTAFYFSSLWGLKPRASMATEKDEKDRTVYELKLKNLSDNLKLLSGTENGLPSVVSVFEKVSQLKEGGIKIEAFKYELKSTGESLFRLQVSASTRKVASDYLVKLHKVEGIEDVIYPILTGDKNLTIPLELILASKKK